MAIRWQEAPQPAWIWRDAAGVPLANGYALYFSSATRLPKSVALDSAGTILVTRVDFTDNGMQPAVFWADDELYYFEIYDSNNNRINTFDNFPPPYVVEVPPEPPVDTIDTTFIMNGQFCVPSVITNPVTANPIRVAEPWFYEQDGDSVNEISVFAFPPGSTTVPFNPCNYFNFVCTGVGTSTTYKRLYQKLGRVQNLNGQQVSLGLYYLSDTSATIQVAVYQFFGTGGTPSAPVETILTSFIGTPSWLPYTATVTIPSISGKTLGTNGDDYIELRILMPLGGGDTATITNIQGNPGSVLSIYPYETEYQVRSQVKGLYPGEPGDSREITYNAIPGALGYEFWLYEDGSAISRSKYADLFSKIGTTFGVGDGSTTFNLPNSGGRSTVASGSSSGTSVRTIGQTGGEENHTLILSETPSHLHNNGSGTAFLEQDTSGSTLITAATGATSAIFYTTNGNTTSQGGDGAHNTMHPYIVYQRMIRY